MSCNFCRHGCIIEIKVRDKGEGLEITVSDNGWGIPEEDMPHLTERFYGSGRGQKIKGTGLGLYICREIVAMNGGDMHIESKPGLSTLVLLSLPHREAA